MPAEDTSLPLYRVYDALQRGKFAREPRAARIAQRRIAQALGVTQAAVSQMLAGLVGISPDRRDVYDRELALGAKPDDPTVEPFYVLASFPADGAPPAGFLGGEDGRLAVLTLRTRADVLALVLEGARGLRGVCPVPVWPSDLAGLPGGADAEPLDACDDEAVTVARIAEFLTGWVTDGRLLAPIIDEVPA